MGLGKSYFASLRGKKVVFERVTSFPDVKLQKVTGYADFEVFFR